MGVGAPSGSDCSDELLDAKENERDGALDSADEASHEYLGRSTLRARRGRCVLNWSSSSSSEELQFEYANDGPRWAPIGDGLLALLKLTPDGLTGLDKHCGCEAYGISFNAHRETARFFDGEECG